MRYDDKSPEVERLQKILIEEGYELPLYGADGHLGDETWEALQRWADDREKIWKPTVPIEVVADVLAGARRRESMLPPSVAPLPAQIYDVRADQASPSPKSRVVGGRTVLRAATAVDAICIHQTAVEFGVTKRMLKQAHNNRELALSHRALQVASHFVAFEGFVAWTNELRRYIYNCNRLNKRALGVEIDGLYPGVMGGPTWQNKPPTVFTEEREAAARAAVKLAVTEGRRAGMPIKYIFAHRQVSSQRRSDPGEEIWRKVVLNYAVPELGLMTKPQFVLSGGRPVPLEWDPNGYGSY